MHVLLIFIDGIGLGADDPAINPFAAANTPTLHALAGNQRWLGSTPRTDSARAIFNIVIPITTEILDRARLLLDEYSQLMARDALHAAVVECPSLEGICSYGSDFDRIASIRRVEPR